MAANPGVAAPASCTTRTDQAMAADLKAATAQSQRADPAALAPLLDEAINLWQGAVKLCEGRAQVRAQRNLADDQKARAALGDLLGAGAACAGIHKDANALQDLARQAVADRRWQEAAMLFRKSENSWDTASERCSGSQAELAGQRRDQVAIDGHNAEFCAPRFDRARDYTQRHRNAAAALAPSDKQNQLQVAETLWREAIQHCKGPPLDLARGHAQTLARDRGTPWVATLLAEPVPTRAPPMAGAAVPGVKAASAQAADAPLPAAAVAAAATTGAVATAKGALAGLGNAPSTVLAPVAPVAAAATAAATLAPTGTASQAAQTTQTAQPIDLALDGGTRIKGLFKRAPDGLHYTGEGDIHWPNGDRYQGVVVAGKRHGQGVFIWPNGQRYQGDWIDDRATGQARMHMANGDLYEGAVRDGQPHGLGKMIFASGDVYTGPFLAGQPHGQGKYIWASGQVYEGPWVNGQADGAGARMVFANGNQFDGDVQRGQPHGQGKLVYASGDVYNGQLAQGKPEGQGHYQWRHGDRYVGQFKAGQKQGQGEFSWANGDRWAGQFKDDQQTEHGQLTRAAPAAAPVPMTAATAAPAASARPAAPAATLAAPSPGPTGLSAAQPAPGPAASAKP